MGNKNEKSRGNTLTNPSTVSIGNFLCDTNQIVIPPNQRPYAWEDEQLSDFFNDLENARELNAMGTEYWHYFNMVTYVRNPENKQQIFIHDGQQRITTSFITLFYLSYKFDKNKIGLQHVDKNLLINIEKFSSVVLKTWDTKRKLQMFSYNDELLTIMVDLYDSPNLIKELEKTLKSKNLLTKSNNRILSMLKKIDSLKYAEDKLWILETFNTLFNNFEVVSGELASSHQAFKIFELVNNRGKKLSNVDLIKNYFYQIADESGRKDDIKDLEQKIGEIIEEIGDYFEDVITKHWLLYFNRNEKSNYGKPTEIFFSVKARFEPKDSNTSLSNAQKRDLMFEFINSIHGNLKYIKNIYTIASLKYEEMMKDSECEKKLNEMNFDIETIKKLVIHRTFVNKEYDYLDYYLYYILLEFQRGGCQINFKYLEEYQSAVNFYVYRSYVNTGKINVDRLNYCLGYRLNRDCDFKNKGLTNVFVQFLLESSDGHENYSQNFKNKLAAPEQEITNDKAKILYQLLYGLDNYSMYYEFKDDKYSIIETEHVLPKSSKKKDFDMYDKFNLQSKDSKYKNKIEWLGNKLVLPKSKNNEVSTNFELKLFEYATNAETYLNKEYFKILVRTFKENDNIPEEEILKRKHSEYCNEIVAMLDTNSVEQNEQYMLIVEDKWRKYIANYFVDYDILKLKSWENIDEIKEK